MTLPKETELFRLQPPGAGYDTWAHVDPSTTQESVDLIEGLDDEVREHMKIAIRVAPFYRWLVPPAAVALQEQLDSGSITIGPQLLTLEQVATLLDTEVESLYEGMHELHAAGLIVMNDEGEFYGRIPAALLQPVTEYVENSGQEG
jgi:hypothetical protein